MTPEMHPPLGRPGRRRRPARPGPRPGGAGFGGLRDTSAPRARAARPRRHLDAALRDELGRSSAPSTCSATPATRAPAHPRQVHPRPAAGPRRGPRRRAGRRRTPGRPGEVEALLAFAVEHHLALVPFGGGTSVTGGLDARREGFAGVVSLDLGRLDRLVAVDPVSRTATLEPGAARAAGGGAARRARTDARPLPAVLRVRHDRRLRGDPVQRPVLGRLRPLRRAGGRPDRRDAGGHGRHSAGARQRRRAGPAPARPRLRGRARRDHLGDGAGAPAARARVYEGGAGRPSTPARTRCAGSPRTVRCRPCCGSRTRRRRRQPGRPTRRRGGERAAS